MARHDGISLPASLPGLLALAALAGPALGQLPNDECATATVLLDGLNAGPFTNAGATDNGADPAWTCGSASLDVWFTYTATCSGAVTFSACAPASAAFDSVFATYTGTCGALALAHCNDDTCGLASEATVPVTAGQTVLLRVGGFLGATGTFGVNVSCLPLIDDFGDAPAGAGVARHTGATASERLGTAVTAEAGTATPSWYGDGGDDGIVSVSSLFPGSTSATIVVHATNPGGTFSDYCRIWVDRNTGVGWSNTTDPLPTQSASVGPAGTNFTFGPFTYTTTAPPSPFVRVRLSFDTTGVSAASSTGSFGEVEDYVLPGSGGPNTTSANGRDAGDAPAPYPPCTSTNTLSERLGTGVTNDANAPVGPDGGDAAWNDDTDDGIVRIDGLTPGGSCTIVVRGSNPLGSFTDTVGGWIDFNNNGTWDEASEAFAPVAASVGPAGTSVTLGPLAVPVTSSGPYRTRLKISFGAAGAQAAGASFTFGEIEDYLLPSSAGIGCNTAPGAAPTIWAEDPPRQGLPFTWKEAGLAPGVGTIVLIDTGTFLPGGIDVSVFAPGLIPPATCFLYVGLGTFISSVGAADPSGNVSVTVPVPPGVAGVTLYLQSFQIAPPLSLLMTPALPLTIFP
jgi:hypothetical protein